MPFSVVNNLSIMIAQQQGAANQMGLQKTLFRLSSGLRINSGGDDAAGLTIADGLSAQVRTLQQSVRNANDGVGFIQVADSALAQATNLLNRAAQLLTEVASATNSGGEVAIESELAQIYQEIDRIGAATSFNGTSVFSATPVDIFVGDTQNLTAANATISFTTGDLSILDLAITTGVTGAGSLIAVDIDLVGDPTATPPVPPDTPAMLSEVEAAIDAVASARGTLGAKINRLEHTVSILQSQVQNLSAAESQIRDADMAAEVANMTKFQILSQVSLAAMGQANLVPQGVLALLT